MRHPIDRSGALNGCDVLRILHLVRNRQELREGFLHGGEIPLIQDCQQRVELIARAQMPQLDNRSHRRRSDDD